MIHTTPTRLVDGVEVPAAGTWRLDPGHAEVAFVGRHFGLTRIRGRFTDVAGTVEIGEDLARSTVEVSIGTASVSSGDERRDAHLRSADFLDVERHPRATFRSTAVEVHGAQAVVVGDLTLVGRTAPVSLEVTYLGHVADPWGDDRIVLSARGRLDREVWGLTWNVVLEAGGLLVSKELAIEIDLELVRHRG
jgi:polyisoprenoid-binding protein YceI